jgi:DNA-binding NtrC family response regulator
MARALIIDDEPIINRLNKKILNGIQIECECLESLDALKGGSAKEIFGYDLVIIDLNLLKKNNGKILEKIKKAKKSIPVLITSGYLRDAAEDYLSKHDSIGYIQKPYTINDFVGAVKRLLEV